MEKTLKSSSDMEQGFRLNTSSGYFQNKGVDVMAFDDFYPSGHQSGVSIIMHGNRIASNGDLRFERKSDASPTPEQGERELNEAANTITTSMSFLDSPSHAPDFKLDYRVTVRGEGKSVILTVDLAKPLPDGFTDTLCFNLELFPGALFGKPWMMDGKQGIFPEQPNGPVFADGLAGEPYAVGKRLTVRPNDPHNRFTIQTRGADLKLCDDRMHRNSGWFVVSSEITAGSTENVVEWVVTPNVVEDWLHTPIVQASQVGYHPNQPKVAIIEMDKRDTGREIPTLYQITETGTKQVFSANGQEWGQFLRYSYLKFDFTSITEEGLYQIQYGSSESSIFRIAHDVYDRGIWQPVLEYFLPVQMCHMRITEKNRIWHDLCHMDDAQMAPVSHDHFDGYLQGPSTLTKYNPGDIVPGLNIGGWHDAGDDDLRIESQAGEVYILAMAYEAFGVDYDATTIDQDARTVEIHQPDGKNDILQQIEHGVLSVIGAYRALGRLYRGIIVNSRKQYSLMGDPASQTDNILGNNDDRWVFTEEHPRRELTAAAHLAAASRVLRGFNDTLSAQSLEAARELFAVTDDSGEAKPAKIHAAVELFLTTGEQAYKDFLLAEAEYITGALDKVGWMIGRVDKALNDAGFTNTIREALPSLKAHYALLSAETPYGIPYRPHIWGAGWDIQRLGFQYYFLHNAYPDIFDPDIVFNALDFVLGRHPGSNNESFASGVGVKSATVAYGWNRADWSFVPGGVISGTALIRPDFPELLVFPYLWQQTEYVLGGGSSNYMFLVLAAQQISGGN